MPSSSVSSRAASASRRCVIEASGSVGSIAGRPARSSRRRCSPMLVSPSRLRTPSALSSMARVLASSCSRTTRSTASIFSRIGVPTDVGMASSRISCRSRRWSSSSMRLCRPPRRSSRPSIRPEMPSMRPAMPSSRPSSCANGFASLSGIASTARMIAGDRGVLRVQLGHGLVEPLGQHADLGAVGQLGQPLAHGAERVEGSETRVDLVERVEDLLLFALADLRGAVEHAAHAVERHGRVCTHGERSFLLCGKGSGRKCSDTAGSPTRRVPVWSLHPIGAVSPARKHLVGGVLR